MTETLQDRLNVTWTRIEHHLEQVEAAVADLQTAVRLRRPPRISAVVQVLICVAFDMTRLLGRLDQHAEDEGQ